MSNLRRIEYIPVISLLFISTFLLLFVFRFLDDNRLTSWTWVFKGVYLVNISLILILGIAVASLASRFSFPERSPALTLFLFSSIATLPFWREPEVIVDVSRYFTQAKHLEIYGIGYFFREWGRDIVAWTDMPLIPFLYGLIFRFLGESREYIQVFTTLAFSMTVVLTYEIGKTLWDEDTGFIAGSLLLGIPYIFTQVPLMLVDIPTMLFLTLSIFTFIKAVESGGVWMYTLAPITIFFAIFSKYSTWPMLSILIIIFLANISVSRHRSHDYNFRFLVTLLISGLLAGAVFLYKFDIFSEQIRLLVTYQRIGLERWGEGFISTFLFQIHPFITAGAVYSFYVAFRKRDIRYAIISWLFILLVLFQMKRIRYTIPLFPMLTLMASYGLQQIRDREIRRFVVSCIVFLSLSLAIIAYLPFVQKITAVNLKDAGKFLDTLKPEEVEVFTLPAIDSPVNPAVSVPVLDLFTKKKVFYHYEPELFHPPGDFERSPLRFTWEYKNPSYYTINHRDAEKDRTVVVISGDLYQTLPHDLSKRIKGFRNSRVFKTSEDIFGYRTFVSVYHD